jgi:DNA-directed RNA polymerase specialized sigma24 family protein
MTRIITNDEFNQEWSNINNRLIMEKACSRFKASINKDELHECKLFALWDAMKYWRPKGKKFTSFLYQKTVWECLKTIKKKTKDNHVNLCIDKAYTCPLNVSEILEKLPNELKDILVKRYIHRMTLREISIIYQCCHETIRRKIIKAIKILKNNHKMEYNKIGTRI